MAQETTQPWEALPEFLAARTYVRCLDRLFQTLPARVQWRMLQPMVAAAVSIGSGIARFHGDPEPRRRVTAGEREDHRRRSLDGIRRSREGLDEIARVPGADRAELLVARELLDRIEGSVREAERPRERGQGTATPGPAVARRESMDPRRRGADDGRPLPGR